MLLKYKGSEHVISSPFVSSAKRAIYFLFQNFKAIWNISEADGEIYGNLS